MRTSIKTWCLRTLVSVALSAALTTCKSSLGSSTAAQHSNAGLSSGVAPRVYVAKVKNLLTGLPPTQDEINAVTADPTALNGLVQGWLVTPQGQAATLTFFRNSFQQAQTPITDFTTMFGSNDENNFRTATAAQLQKEFIASFENTAWQLAVVQGQPFNSLWTTRTFAVTTAMLSIMLANDGMQVDSNGNPFSVYDNFYASELSAMSITTGNPTGSMTAGGVWSVQSALTSATTNVLGKSFATTSANTPSLGVNCSKTGTAKIAIHPGSNKYADSIFELLVGFPVPVSAPDPSCFNPTQPASCTSGDCAPVNPPWDMSYTGASPNGLYPYIAGAFQVAGGQFTAADHSDWRLVTTRDLMAGETPARFWDLPTLRQASTTNTIPTMVQRVGPFTTPAFLANWVTNANNQARSTANQMLIVAIGASFDGSNVSVQSSTANQAANNDQSSLASGESAADASHASTAACQSCHTALDPLRRFYSKQLGYNWAQQLPNSVYTAEAPYFNFGGVTTAGNSFADLGNILSQHPALATAWVQKACYWINSAPCSEDDPEFIQVAADFQKGFQFPAMIAELFSSSMITNAAPSATQDDQGEVISISRLDHLCATLSSRLSNSNLCTYNSTVTSITPNIPSDGYTRGATEPFQPSQPGLFFRAAAENFCAQIASAVVDAPASGVNPAGPYSSSDLAAATDDMVHNLMAILPGDPREAQALAILNGHYTKALVSGATPTTALRSTFVLACTSPAVISIGL